ncbi:RnfABCDGE type electron transport complex subunit D [Neobacillus drentensis]|uniref:RnfABCDGE type electron transport complex subunit D n=1 Tax=Neobacillus drentensis TaxID=220684 RepID=UPI0008253021|nr:RnfABCDGE type electron transport complex subunit D [Neobacillus drentensis]
MTIQKWIKTPKGYVTATLVSYLIIASIGSKNIMGVKNGIIAICLAFVVDFLYCRMKNRKSSKDSTVITGLFISLILSFTTPWQIVAGTAVIAILSKHLLVYKKKPIFNPAAVGLLLSIFIFQTGQSWWGAFGDLPAWTIIFLVIGGYLITDRVNKFPQVLSFLGTFFVLLLLMGMLNVGNAADAFRPPFINATLFFSFFMLTDPPTSPAKYKNQVLFGILSAVSGVLVYGIFGGLTYLFIGLFIGNIYSYLQKRSSSKATVLTQNVKTQYQTRTSRNACR